jgi:antitoxin MazE
MTHLIKIGNSQGIRIPKTILKQSDFEGKELKLQLVSNGILITPIKQIRDGWKESIDNALDSQVAEKIDHEWLDAKLTTDEELEW